MRDQTCPTLWTRLAAGLRSAGALVAGRPGEKRRHLYRIVTLAALIFLSWIVFRRPLRPDSAGMLIDDGDPVPVLAADRYIPAFRAVSPALVRRLNFPPELVPPGALHEERELRDAEGRCRFVASVGIPENQPLTRALLEDMGRRQGVSSLLSSGKVAISLAVERSRAAGGWIRPGDTVAILHNRLPEKPGSAPHPTTALFSSVEVLAVDGVRLNAPVSDAGQPPSFDVPETGLMTLTLRLNPVEAAALIDARERGPLDVVLRAPGDDLTW